MQRFWVGKGGNQNVGIADFYSLGEQSGEHENTG